MESPWIAKTATTCFPRRPWRRPPRRGTRPRKSLSTSARFFEEVEKAGGPLPELAGPLDSLENIDDGLGLHGNQNVHVWGNQNEDLLLSTKRPG